jgi:hypothetical protein
LEYLLNPHCNPASKAQRRGFDFCDDQNKLINTLWGHILTIEGLDWFSWFMYEKNYISGKIKKHLTAKDESGKEICKDLKGLHEYLVTQMYFKN